MPYAPMLPGPARRKPSTIYQMVLNHASLVRDVQQPPCTKRALCASPAGISCGTGWYPRQADQDVALLQPIIIPCDFYNFRLGISKMLKACCSCGHKAAVVPNAAVVIQQAARHQSGEGSVMTHKGLASACLSFLASCWTLCADSAACCSSSSCLLTCTSESES